MRVTALPAVRPVMGAVAPGTNIPEPGEFGVTSPPTPPGPGCSYAHSLAGVIPPGTVREAAATATAGTEPPPPAESRGALARKDDPPTTAPGGERRARDRPFAHGRLPPGEPTAPAQTGRPRPEPEPDQGSGHRRAAPAGAAV
jgi:hypothetical protein